VGAVLTLSDTTIRWALIFSAWHSYFTDYLDGSISRQRGLVHSTYGILMDPLADKVLVCSAFIARFVESNAPEVRPAPVKVAAVDGQSSSSRANWPSHRMRCWRRQKKSRPRTTIGKLKTIFQIVTIIALLITDAAN